MSKRIALLLMVGVVVSLTAAQEAKPPASERHGAFASVGPTYRLDFTVKELDDGKLLNTRSYTMLVTSTSERGNPRGSVKSVTRIPVTTVAGDKSGAPTTTYINAGFELSANLFETDKGLLLQTYTEIGSLAPPEVAPAATNPLIRSVEMSSSSQIVLGKPLLLGSVDDVSSRHRFQVEAVAHRVE